MTRRARATVTAVLALTVVTVLLPGCGEGGKVTNYTTFANKVIDQLNTSEIQLKKYWTTPLSEQEGAPEALADFRKVLASCQEQLDATDVPEPARPLKDLVSAAVAQGRRLADLTTQFADYLGAMAPLAKKAALIVTQLQGIQSSQYVPSTVAGLLANARQLETSMRTLMPNATFEDINKRFQEFVALLVKDLAEADRILAASAHTPASPDPDRDRDAEEDSDDRSPASTPEEEVSAETKRQIASIRKYTDEVFEAWADFNEKVNEELAGAREANGVRPKASEVEDCIGRAVEQIKILEQKYK